MNICESGEISSLKPPIYRVGGKKLNRLNRGKRIVFGIIFLKFKLFCAIDKLLE